MRKIIQKYIDKQSLSIDGFIRVYVNIYVQVFSLGLLYDFDRRDRKEMIIWDNLGQSGAAKHLIIEKFRLLFFVRTCSLSLFLA